MLCGIVLCQEVPGIPKVKPYLKNAWAKINPPSSEAAAAVNESDDGQASNKSD